MKITNNKIYKKLEEKGNLGEVVTSFINHHLQSGGYPSFYKDNFLEGKFTYSIQNFILVEFKSVKL